MRQGLGDIGFFTALLVVAASTVQAQVRGAGYVQGTTVFPREAPGLATQRAVDARADSLPAATRPAPDALRLPYAAGTYAPGTYAPGSYSVGSYAAPIYAPGTYAPGSYASGGYAPGSYSPGTYSPGSYTPGSYTPNSYLAWRASPP
jgi:hypothetical protein